MVVAQTLFQTKGAGDGFRRFRLGPGRVAAGDRVDDLVALKPFPGAASRTPTIVLTKGAATAYPVPYVKWRPGARRGTGVQPLPGERPIDAARPGSPWLIDRSGRRPAGKGTTAAPRRRGPSDYAAHLGANSGGANAVYWLRSLVARRPAACRCETWWRKAKHGVAARRAVPGARSALSAAPLGRPPAAGRRGRRPTCCWSRTWRRGPAWPRPDAREYPQTRPYLQKFQELLTAPGRLSPLSGPEAVLLDVQRGPYTVAPIKVVWRRMDRQIRAAVVASVDNALLGRRRSCRKRRAC